MSQTLTQAIVSVGRRITALYPYGLDAVLATVTLGVVFSSLESLNFGEFPSRWSWAGTDREALGRLTIITAICLFWDDGRTRPAVRSALSMAVIVAVWLQHLMRYQPPIVMLVIVGAWIMFSRLPRQLQGCTIRDLFWIQAIAATSIYLLLNYYYFPLIVRSLEPRAFVEHLKTIQTSWLDNLVGSALLIAVLEFLLPFWRRFESTWKRLVVLSLLFALLPFIQFRIVFSTPSELPWSLYAVANVAIVLLIWFEICRAIGVLAPPAPIAESPLLTKRDLQE